MAVATSQDVKVAKLALSGMHSIYQSTYPQIVASWRPGGNPTSFPHFHFEL